MKLSILICHLEGREKKLAELLRILGDQVRPNVEILVEKDNGEISTGAKRNKLLEKAKGDYVCFIDDDDIVPEYYIDEILTALKANPDCVGFNGVLKYPNGQTKSCEYRMGQINVTQSNGGYKCGIGHLSPVKREIALKVKFPDKKILEDYEYAKEIQKYLGSEQFINRTMYIYKQK